MGKGEKARFRKTRAHRRYVTRAGEVVKGITSIIGDNLGWNKNILVAWARREALAGNDPTKVKDRAADIGSLAHFMVECHLKGVEPDLSEFSEEHISIATQCFNGFLAWKESQGLEAIDTEVPLVSEMHRYGGTRDILGTIGPNKSKVIIDAKTSKDVYTEHIIQGAALCHLYWENELYVTGGVPLENVGLLALKDRELYHYESKPSEWLPYIVIKLGKDGSFGYTQYLPSQLLPYWEIFRICLKLEKLRRTING